MSSGLRPGAQAKPKEGRKAARMGSPERRGLEPRREQAQRDTTKVAECRGSASAGCGQRPQSPMFRRNEAPM